MPTYAYRREDGTKFEVQQRITDDPLETCPETGQEVERIITGSAGLIFKGEGFYVNDYGNGSPGANGSADAAGAESPDAASSDAASGDASSSDAASSDTERADASTAADSERPDRDAR